MDIMVENEIWWLLITLGSPSLWKSQKLWTFSVAPFTKCGWRSDLSSWRPGHDNVIMMTEADDSFDNVNETEMYFLWSRQVVHGRKKAVTWWLTTMNQQFESGQKHSPCDQWPQRNQFENESLVVRPPHIESSWIIVSQPESSLLWTEWSMQYHAMPCHAMSCIIVGHLSINIPPSTEQTRNAVPPSRVTALYFCTVPKNTQKYQKLPPKVTVSTPNCQCPGTNQKYCASQQGDCKHIGYCDPNATCKKKANMSFCDIPMLCWIKMCLCIVRCIYSGYSETFFSPRLASLDSIGSANATRDGLVSSKGGRWALANTNTNATNTNANINQTWKYKHKYKNAGNGIQCMDSNGTLSALPGQQVEASVNLFFVFLEKI